MLSVIVHNETMDIDLVGQKVKAHLEEIQRIVDQLFKHNSIHILCVVEVGQPRIGLSVEATKLEEAVRAGVAKHIRGDFVFVGGLQ